MKLSYFRSSGWEQQWIQTAEDMVTEEFAKYDKPMQSVEADETTAQDEPDLFDIPMEAMPTVSELKVHLSQPIEKVKDPISWWWEHRAVFPRLSVMALDYLSAPGMFALLCAVFPQVFMPTLHSIFNRRRAGVLERATPTSLHSEPAFCILNPSVVVSWRLVSQESCGDV